MPKPETAKFRIKTGGTSVSFRVVGSTVVAMVEAFRWLTPERRLSLLERLQAKQAELLQSEAERAKAQKGE